MITVAERALDEIVLHLAPLGGLVWAHAQGSVTSGFTADSDLDVVAVWDRMPDASVLPGGRRSLVRADLIMEQAEIARFEVDLQHVAGATFQQWIERVRAGEGWSDDEWPQPIYSASGLAEGLLLVDPDGRGSAAREGVRTPTATLVACVREELATVAPGYGGQLRKAASRGDHWLFDHLATRFHRLIYTAWFVVEGHLSPFPKHLEQWADRFDLDHAVRYLERQVWAASNRAGSAEALIALASAVLDLPVSSS